MRVLPLDMLRAVGLGISFHVLGVVQGNSTYERALPSHMVTRFKRTPLPQRPSASTKRVKRQRIKYVDHQQQEEQPEIVVQRPRSEFNILHRSTFERFNWNTLDEIKHKQAFKSNEHDSYS